MNDCSFIELMMHMDCPVCGEELDWDVIDDYLSAYCCTLEFKLYKSYTNRIIVLISNCKQND